MNATSVRRNRGAHTCCIPTVVLINPTTARLVAAHRGIYAENRRTPRDLRTDLAHRLRIIVTDNDALRRGDASHGEI